MDIGIQMSDLQRKECLNLVKIADIHMALGSSPKEDRNLGSESEEQLLEKGYMDPDIQCVPKETTLKLH